MLLEQERQASPANRSGRVEEIGRSLKFGKNNEPVVEKTCLEFGVKYMEHKS